MMARKYIRTYHERPIDEPGKTVCQILEIALDGRWSWNWVYLPLAANDEYLESDFDFDLEH
ncbi:hypothetical protein BH11PSE5_BH11PSE5_32530 [soil metagenome]